MIEVIEVTEGIKLQEAYNVIDSGMETMQTIAFNTLKISSNSSLQVHMCDQRR